MKKTLYLFLLFAGMAQSQNVIFNGSLFKDALLDSDVTNTIAKNAAGQNIKIDSSGDGNISLFEAQAVFTLEIKNYDLTNLVGIEAFVNLTGIDFKNNLITSVNLETIPNLTKIDFKNNSLTTLDLSNQSALITLDIGNNLLTSLYLKNGANEIVTTTGNASLVYVCTDESQVTELQGQFGSQTEINSYCSLTPGGNYNKIAGKVIFDANNNGTLDDIPQANIKVFCEIGNNNILQTVTNDLGEYEFNTMLSGPFELRVNIAHPEWFNGISAFVGSNLVGTNNLFQHDFTLTPISSQFDNEIMISPLTLPTTTTSTPDLSFQIIIKNNGTQNESGQVTFNYNNSLLDFDDDIITNDGIIIINEVQTSPDISTITLSYDSLKPFESKSFTIELEPLTTFVSNQQLQVSAHIIPNGELPATIADNTFVFNQGMSADAIYSWTKCMQGSLVSTSEIGNYLHYAIHYVNTGTQTIDNITVNTLFDTTKYNLESLQILDSTFPQEARITNGVVTTQSRNANLGGPGGQGTVFFKIKTNDDLQAGDEVSVSSEVFFDYDYNLTNTAPTPILTDVVTTTFQNLNTSVYTIDQTVKVYPNPVQDVLTVSGDFNFTTIELYDVYGRLLQTRFLDATSANLDISQRASGTYFLKISSEKGQKVEKIVKQ